MSQAILTHTRLDPELAVPNNALVIGLLPWTPLVGPPLMLPLVSPQPPSALSPASLSVLCIVLPVTFTVLFTSYSHKATSLQHLTSTHGDRWINMTSEGLKLFNIYIIIIEFHINYGYY